MKLLLLLVIINSIILQSRAVFMNGFQTITLTPQSTINLHCHETINVTEIDQIVWYQSHRDHISELSNNESSITIENISENTIFICQYTYYSYIYWFEIYFINIDLGKCPKTEPNKITTDQTEKYTMSQPTSLSATETVNNAIEYTASKQPILSSGEMRTAATFTFTTCAICHAIFVIFYFKKNY